MACSSPVTGTTPEALLLQGFRVFFIGPQGFQGIQLRIVHGALRDAKGLFLGKNAHARAHGNVHKAGSYCPRLIFH